MSGSAFLYILKDMSKDLITALQKHVSLVPTLSWAQTLDFKALKFQLKTEAFKYHFRGLNNYLCSSSQVNTCSSQPTKQATVQGPNFGYACKNCHSLPEECQCVQYFEVRESGGPDESSTCQSVSLTPKKPKKRCDRTCPVIGPTPPILNALDADLKLEFLEADEDCIKACGRHLIWLIDADTREKIKETLNKMIGYHKSLTDVQPLSCGSQFNYSQSSLNPYPSVDTSGYGLS
ncbi:hypothetical protein DFH09DRAFT_1078729 [Mycena vulgaris]|nr:hypothetical protein DFH09DRAFT_1078729 [Mycena vulgaris]